MKRRNTIITILLAITSIMLVSFINCPEDPPPPEPPEIPNYNRITPYTAWYNNFESYSLSSSTATSDALTDWSYDKHYAWIVDESPDIAVDADTTGDKMLSYTSVDYTGRASNGFVPGDPNDEPAPRPLISIPPQPGATWSLNDPSGDLQIRYLIFWAKKDGSPLDPYGDDHRIFVNCDSNSPTISQAWSNVVGIPTKGVNGGIMTIWRRYIIDLDDKGWSDPWIGGTYVANNLDVNTISSINVALWGNGRNMKIDNIYFAANKDDPCPGVAGIYDGTIIFYDDGDY